MSVGHYHGLCNRYRGRAVEIRTHDQHTHRGIIQHVDNRNVFLRPIGRSRGLGGFGFGFFGPGIGGLGGFGGFGGPGGYGGGFGVGLGSIAALRLLPLLFW